MPSALVVSVKPTHPKRCQAGKGVTRWFEAKLRYYFERRVALGTIDSARVTGGGLGVLVTEPVLVVVDHVRLATQPRELGVGQEPNRHEARYPRRLTPVIPPKRAEIVGGAT